MDKFNDVVIVGMDKKIIELERTIKSMKPIQTWDEAQSEIQKQMGEIIKAVWDAGVKLERERIINLFEGYDVYMQAEVIASGMFDIIKRLKQKQGLKDGKEEK